MDLLIAVYVAVWIVEFGLFGMQRASLLISRSAGIEWRGGGELLLPPWFPLTWGAIASKWILLLAMAIKGRWGLAIVLYTTS